MAIGANPSDVLTLVLLHGGRLAAGGVALGLVGAVALSRLMTNQLHDVSATDPWIFGGVAAVLAAVAMVATTLPALRASRIDPLLALRGE